jgi:hypothetical protein
MDRVLRGHCGGVVGDVRVNMAGVDLTGRPVGMNMVPISHVWRIVLDPL